jgi:Enoyl-CoA hydratase/isomerase
MLRLTDRELMDQVRSPFAFETFGIEPTVAHVTCRSTTPTPPDLDVLHDRIAGTPVVLVGIVDPPDDAGRGAASLCDVVMTDDDPGHDALLTKVARFPNASVALAVLLRDSERRGIGEGLAAESAVYSLLQAGPEFSAWRARRPIAGRPPETTPTVEMSRDGDVLELALARPHVHNAFDTRMRDELIAALTVAAADPSLKRVVIVGRGPSFCSGGDLDEFGTRSDPATAHRVRLAASAGRVIADIAARVEVHLHGACMGSGIELAAFAGTVISHPDATISLPEIGLGLIPGAGGTVSLPRRIGRQRTAYLALSGRPIDAEIALAWGLADRLAD